MFNNLKRCLCFLEKLVKFNSALSYLVGWELSYSWRGNVRRGMYTIHAHTYLWHARKHSCKTTNSYYYITGGKMSGGGLSGGNVGEGEWLEYHPKSFFIYDCRSQRAPIRLATAPRTEAATARHGQFSTFHRSSSPQTQGCRRCKTVRPS